MSHVVNWMITLTLAFCLLAIILFFTACQTTKSCKIDCIRNLDNIPLCEEVCER